MLTYMLEFPERDRYDTSSLELVWTGGAGTPLRGAARIRTGVQLSHHRRLRHDRVQRLGGRLLGWRRVRPGSVGRAMPGVEPADRRRRRPRPAGARHRRAPDPGRHHMLGYWRDDEATQRDPARRLASSPATWLARRRRLPLHRRPQEGPHHQGRREHRAARDRGVALPPSRVAEPPWSACRTRATARTSGPRSSSRRG